MAHSDQPLRISSSDQRAEQEWLGLTPEDFVQSNLDVPLQYADFVIVVNRRGGLIRHLVR